MMIFLVRLIWIRRTQEWVGVEGAASLPPNEAFASPLLHGQYVQVIAVVGGPTPFVVETVDHATREIVQLTLLPRQLSLHARTSGRLTDTADCPPLLRDLQVQPEFSAGTDGAPFTVDARYVDIEEPAPQPEAGEFQPATSSADPAPFSPVTVVERTPTPQRSKSAASTRLSPEVTPTPEEEVDWDPDITDAKRQKPDADPVIPEGQWCAGACGRRATVQLESGRFFADQQSRPAFWCCAECPKGHKKYEAGVPQLHTVECEAAHVAFVQDLLPEAQRLAQEQLSSDTQANRSILEREHRCSRLGCNRPALLPLKWPTSAGITWHCCTPCATSEGLHTKTCDDAAKTSYMDGRHRAKKSSSDGAQARVPTPPSREQWEASRKSAAGTIPYENPPPVSPFEADPVRARPAPDGRHSLPPDPLPAGMVIVYNEHINVPAHLRPPFHQSHAGYREHEHLRQVVISNLPFGMSKEAAFGHITRICREAELRLIFLHFEHPPLGTLKVFACFSNSSQVRVAESRLHRRVGTLAISNDLNGWHVEVNHSGTAKREDMARAGPEPDDRSRTREYGLRRQDPPPFDRNRSQGRQARSPDRRRDRGAGDRAHSRS